MKKDQYIPHEVSMRHTTEVMDLIEKEGVTGYGIYWAIMEYLRTQDDYIGDFRALKNLARQLKVRPSRILKILREYGLFVCNDFTFYSPKLTDLMKEFDDRRARIEAYKRKKRADNLLEINNGDDTISFEVKGKGEGKGEGKVSSSSKEEDEEGGGDVDVASSSSFPTTLAWERYIDELGHEQQWIEIMAMRSGMGLDFVKRFGDVLKHFKLHIRSIGNEKDIQSPSDAKRYFCFYNTPGSAPFLKLLEYLKRTEAPDPYRYEQRDTQTGKRSYCGVPIPDDAPPRPNNQAVWCEERWVY